MNRMRVHECNHTKYISIYDYRHTLGENVFPNDSMQVYTHL